MDDAVQQIWSTANDVHRSTECGIENSDSALRAKARTLIQQGILPESLPKQRLGGHGNGAPCSVCDVAIQEHELEIEIERASGNGAGAANNLRFHFRCLAALEHEIQALRQRRI